MSKEQNVVYIGRKPTMSYVSAVLRGLTESEVKEITLKARGRAITTAVDVVEITRRRFMTDINIEKIETGTEVLELEEGGTRTVSTIEITLSKKE